MITRPRVGLFGGTFDPIHYGHVSVARLAARALAFDLLHFIPSGSPPHRPDSPRASGYHRVEMIRRAIADEMIDDGVAVEVSDLELRRDRPSYTDDTLRAFHSEGLTPVQLVFITGADAFAEIATWHRYPEVLDAAHFAIVARPGMTLASLQQRLPTLAHRMIRADQLDRASMPRIVLVDGDPPAIAATDIRRRAAHGESLDGLVPPSVAAYIEKHELYRVTSAATDATVNRNAPDAPEPASGYGKVSRS
jgi:nicotinate-nucleotide adenylyltransferase